MNEKNERLLLSVSVVTYNQKNYIEQCLEGILMQQTNFNYEIILGEDASTDGTREICIDYANKYPDKIRLFLRHRKDVIYINGNATGRFNMMENLKACKGKYIALCEGDDYWTDPLKLQKQVDFLETHKEYKICSHVVTEVNHFNNMKKRIIPPIEDDTIYTIEDYVLNNKTATCSLVFKRDGLKYISDSFNQTVFGDLTLIITILKNSNQNMYTFKKVMGVYRVHKGGIHTKYRENEKKLISAYKQHIDFANYIKREMLFEKKYSRMLLEKKINTYSLLLNLAKKQNRFWQFYFYKLMYHFNKIQREYL